jgi:hypothetical protein
MSFMVDRSATWMTGLRSWPDGQPGWIDAGSAVGSCVSTPATQAAMIRSPIARACWAPRKASKRAAADVIELTEGVSILTHSPRRLRS